MTECFETDGTMESFKDQLNNFQKTQESCEAHAFNNLELMLSGPAAF